MEQRPTDRRICFEDSLLLSDAGIHTHIDDFGTGYSSLGYLSDLQGHGLKIDRSFIGNLERNEKNAAIVASTISLAKNLGLSTIAQGVETLEQLEYLREAQCEYGQGYYFSPPLTPDMAVQLLQTGIRIGSKKKVET